MQKFLIMVAITLLSYKNVYAGTKWGKGDLTLSSNTVTQFIKYIKGNFSKTPHLFAVSEDGNSFMYYFCPSGPNNCRGGDEAIITDCEKYSNGVDCHLFARNRTIKWKNQINRGNKDSKINSKWSEDKIRAKLTDLGFLDNTKESKQSNNIKKKITNKEEKIATSNKSMTEELKTLNELYKSGVLTAEEFKKAKDKLLN